MNIKIDYRLFILVLVLVVVIVGAVAHNFFRGHYPDYDTVDSGPPKGLQLQVCLSDKKFTEENLVIVTYSDKTFRTRIPIKHNERCSEVMGVTRPKSGELLLADFRTGLVPAYNGPVIATYTDKNNGKDYKYVLPIHGEPQNLILPGSSATFSLVPLE